MQTSYSMVKYAAFIQLATPTYAEMNQEHVIHLLKILKKMLSTKTLSTSVDILNA